MPDLEYHGFVEGNDIGKGTVDVVVTEGFAGNIALKTAEGTARQIGEYLKGAMSRTLSARIGYLFARSAFRQLREVMDPRKVERRRLSRPQRHRHQEPRRDRPRRALPRPSSSATASSATSCWPRSPRRSAAPARPRARPSAEWPRDGTRSVILGCGSYLPAQILTNGDLARKVDTSDDWIVQRTGIHERHIAAPGE